ncbi:MAG TPA: AMP-binding protein [Longimicrobiales bacterium]|nr:AMP-binding protein [Longimicrobiales bacterium]
MSNDHTNLANILWHAADHQADRAVVLEGDAVTTLAQLRARASAFALALHAGHVQPGARVAIFLERSADAVAAIFGAYAAGAVTVVVNERYRPRQIEHIVQHCDVTALITSQSMLDRHHRDLDINCKLIDQQTVEHAAQFSPVRRISPDGAQIIYTSGSTGLPKGVFFNNAALHAGVNAVKNYLGIDPSDRVATLLPFSSVYGLNQVLTSVAAGASIVIERALLPNKIVSGLAERGTTVLAAVPPLWIQLLNVPDFNNGALRGLRIAQNAGGHLPPEFVKRVRAALPDTRLFLQYGMTETFRGTYLPPDDVDARPGSMGRPMPDTEVYVVDEHGQPVADGEIGELVHRGPTIALGYWKDPEATRQTFRPNPFLPEGTPAGEKVVFSGDMVRRDTDGYLYYVGRRDRVIKSMGFRVGPDEIADVLYASGEAAEAIIVAVADAERGQRIVAHVVLKPDSTLERLKRFCRAELPEYAQPAEYVVQSEIPRLPSGKYDVDMLTKASTRPAAEG